MVNGMSVSKLRGIWSGAASVVRWPTGEGPAHGDGAGPARGRVPVVTRWRKRIFECRYPLCPSKTWTEQHPAIASRAVLTERARQWAFEQVGRHDRAVAPVAAGLGVAWNTIMIQVKIRGKPLVDDPPATRRGDGGRGRRNRVPPVLQHPPHAVRDRHRRSHPGPPGAPVGRRRRPLRHPCSPGGSAPETNASGRRSSPPRSIRSVATPPRSPRSYPKPSGSWTPSMLSNWL